MMRRRRVLRIALACAATVLSGIGAILAINTWRFKSRQLEVPPIPRIPLDESPCAARLAAAIQFQTVSREDPDKVDPAPFLALHEFLAQTYPQTHKTLERDVVGDFSLLYTWKGRSPAKEAILLMSHVDVVPVAADTESEWTYPPFSGRISGGYVWGRGALDVKCGAMGILEAVEHLLNEGFQPECTVYLALGHDEEVGGRGGNAEIAARLKREQIRLRYVLDEGGVITEGVIDGVPGSVAFVGIAEKGYFSVKLTAAGPGGHSSMPPRQTSIGILAAALARLESNQMPARIDGATATFLEHVGPEMSFDRRMILANPWLFAPAIKHLLAAERATNATIRTTTALTMIEGGVSKNVLPEKASAQVNFRLLPGDTLKDVGRHVRETINDDRVKTCEYRWSTEASAVSDVHSRDLRTLHRTIRQVFPEVIVAPGLTVVTTDSRHYEAISDNTFRFIPARVGPADLERIHGVDERISVENYLEIIRFFIQQIRNSTS